MCKFRFMSILFLLFLSLNVQAQTLDDAFNGTIKIDYEKSSSDRFSRINSTIDTITARISQISTSLTLFTTSLLHITGYSQTELEQDMGYKYRSYQQQDSSIDSAGMFMFLGTLGTSLVNYRFGFDNDMLAIIPVFPKLVDGPNGRSFLSPEEEQYDHLQYGVYFYFSQNF